MKREMKRRDLIMNKHDIIRYLLQNNYGVLSTVSESNIPYGVPMNYVYHDNFIYLHCMAEGHRIDNIRNNVHVCFSIASIVAFGKIAIVSEEIEKQKALLIIAEKSNPDDNVENTNTGLIEKACILKTQIANMTGKQPG